jgi:hypothetical protein
MRTPARRALAGLAVLGALATVVVAAAPAVSTLAASPPAVSTLVLPSGAGFDSVEPLGDRLLISGYDNQGDGCRWLVVTPATLHVDASLQASCERPAIATEPFVPVEFPLRSSNSFAVRIARPNADAARVSYGPVVMTFPDVSDTGAEFAYGPGTLWIYDVAARQGGALRAEALDVSTTTGAVVRTVHLPKLYRPLLAADADGLWIADSPEGGDSAPVPLYLLAPGASRPRLVHRGGYAAFWLLAAGHTAWADIASSTRHLYVIRQELWRFDGTSASAHALAGADELTEPGPALAPGARSLWTISGVSSSGRFYSCHTQRVVRIDARTGRQSVVATLALPGQPCDPDRGVAYGGNADAFVDGAFYFLDDVGAASALYRVEP